jgi:methyl-accepting chemotaxis protein
MTASDEKIGRLIRQVDQFTESLPEMRAIAREQLIAAQSQAENIKRIADRTERQNTISERLAATVERQSQMLETLMSRQQ